MKTSVNKALVALSALLMGIALTGCNEADIKALRVYFGLAPASSIASDDVRSMRLLRPTSRRSHETTPDLEDSELEEVLPELAEEHLAPASGGTPYGEPCSGAGEDAEGNSRHCVALKYVAFHGTDGEDPTPALEGINSIWAQCGILFQVDEYWVIDPTEHALRYDTADYEELDEIRTQFKDDRTLLVVATGTWNRSGSLGDSWANAWTYMPGHRNHGVVMEREAANFAGIVAHELGHYLGLDHWDESVNVMHPVIYERSKRLTRKQCETAKVAIEEHWLATLR